jgi:hypothetical protein
MPLSLTVHSSLPAGGKRASRLFRPENEPIAPSLTLASHDHHSHMQSFIGTSCLPAAVLSFRQFRFVHHTANIHYRQPSPQ